MKGKVLFCANIHAHIAAFHRDYVELLRSAGYEVHIAAKGCESGAWPNDVTCIEMPWERSPYRAQNLAAFRTLKRRIDAEGYALIHCHTPTAALVTRLAARQARKRGTIVFYTAHGFHFYRGAPIVNWLLYYPVERFFARWTDCLATINDEDYAFATEKLPIERIEQLPVGYDDARFRPGTDAERQALRAEIGVPLEAEVLIYAAGLEGGKNHGMLLRAFGRLAAERPRLRLYLLGRGPERAAIEAKIAAMELKDRVFLLGYRGDVERWMRLADAVVSTSMREGQGVNLLEGMASGQLVAATANRGHLSAVEEGVTGYLVPLGDDEAFAAAIERALEATPAMRERAAAIARETHSRSAMIPRYAAVYGALLHDETLMESARRI